MTVWGSAIEEPRGVLLCDRAEHARTAVEAHTLAAGLAAEDSDDPGSPAPADGIVHLLCDLMHLTMELGIDFSAALGAAEHHFVEERVLESTAAAS